MTSTIQLKTTTPPLLITLALLCFGLVPQMQAVDPAPDGCYPNFTTAEGCDALSLLTTGAGNTALGFRSLFLDTTGSFNTGVGGGALVLNNGDSNTAVGAAALLLNTTGTQNTATGTDALVFNDSGSFNTANGAFALFSNTEGTNNTATGSQALFSNTDGTDNTASGSQALFNNTTGDANTAIGTEALFSNTDGNSNTAVGVSALFFNDIGFENTATGTSALSHNTTGGGNTAIGVAALVFNTTGSNNTALGANAGVFVDTASSVIAIGSPGADVSNSCFIGQIRGVTTALNDAIPVVIASDGQLGTMSSSRRFKKEIKPMDKTSEAIHSLKPVTFHYKSDETNRPEFGLIAEEVAEVNPDLVVRDENGEIYTVRYDAVNAMLLNEFLKAHRKMEEQQNQIDLLTAQLRKQSALIQRVSDKVELNESQREVVENE